MANKAKITLSLSGASQAWGDLEATLAERTCSPLPTKRGVVGLISAGMGIERNSPRIKELENEVDFKVVDACKGKGYTDFETLGIRRFYDYDKNGNVSSVKVSLANGKYQAKNVIMNKYYTSGACHVVEITGPSETIKEIATSIIAPKYPLYLGRKCCMGRIDIIDVSL